MRSCIALLLMGLIFACPFVCGLAEDACATNTHHVGGEQSGKPGSSHCPEDGDDCICSGAVQSSDVRLPELDAVSQPFLRLHLIGCLPHSPSHPLIHLTIDGTPTGLARWGDSLAVRAFLQNFRC